MPAYWLARAIILEPRAYREYTDRLPAITLTYGGKVLSRGARYKRLEGSDAFQRFAAFEFESLEVARGCCESPKYVDVATFRRSGASENQLTVVDAGDGSQ